MKSGWLFFSVNLERPVVFPCLQPHGRGLFEPPLEHYGNTSCLRAKHLVLNPSVSTLTHLFPWTLTILEKISVCTSKWMIRSQRIFRLLELLFRLLCLFGRPDLAIGLWPIRIIITLGFRSVLLPSPVAVIRCFAFISLTSNSGSSQGKVGFLQLWETPTRKKPFVCSV